MKKIFAALVFIATCACTSIPTNLEKPTVNLQQVDVSSASFTDANLVFNFIVKNPNSVPVSVDQVNYDLKLNGRPFTKGVLEKGLKVGPNASVVVPLPVAVKYTDLTSSLSDLLQQGSSKYEITGAVKLGLFSIPFSQVGDVKLSDLNK